MVLHLPIHYFTEPYPTSEAAYMVGSTLHWARLLNGFSGGEPVGFLERMRLLATLPAPGAVAELRRLGVEVLAVHITETAARRDAVASYFNSQPGVSILRLAGGDYLVLLLDLPRVGG